MSKVVDTQVLDGGHVCDAGIGHDDVHPAISSDDLQEPGPNACLVGDVHDDAHGCTRPVALFDARDHP